jgi:hypothetical protein
VGDGLEMNEPRWRTVLCWGATVFFLGVPLMVFALHELNMLQATEYRWLGQSYQSITALVFGLSGLRSFDHYVETKNGDKR